MTTSSFSGGQLNSQCASINSKPLFIIDAESTEILRPMLQFGCLTACSGVMLSNVLKSVLRKGPPDAVRIIELIPCSFRRPV
ncbi:Uncharacterised protein [Mycobacteroides abscessus subsp. massiliense]|nr:Uncharacterised protein [Mycobacteroides abscessus subsp. massiliense]